ncbi:cyclin-dependent kinase inhibitor 1C-like isoform X2 [Drosophila gunungcola]|uniref:cyclin-dependent kinase inhibitor 1C-like isoform X2 n=1 Tax=Drosophila gunungcola TaxID=103775 RepID=UPI0022E7A900|nr:cyclin-dependent kinase inhibitor 1C-like isoform X2 [Drosophila gunungcola]XP_052847619.1 cyclin-dependent kinase inhibitor 1C-like isoform X2 [Drosophila gunungcola]
MKFFLLLALALVGIAAGAQLPDSATQGPNPQDIATPEPEYIDIDEPAPAAAAPAPRPVAAAPRPVFAAPAPIPRPVARPVAVAQSFVQQPIVQRAQYLAPVAQQQVVLPQQQQLVGHTYNSRAGYQYRRPVYH